MRRSIPLLIAALAGAAVAIPLQFAAASTVQNVVPPGGPPTAAERFGIVRYDNGSHKWTLLNTAPNQSSGLTGVSCSSSTGKLTVTFEPMTIIGTFMVDEDEAYAGRYDAGGSASQTALTIIFRKVSTGAVVACDASELRITNSNLQLWVRGSIVGPTSPPTMGPTTPPIPSDPQTTRPTTVPTAVPTSGDPGGGPGEDPPTNPPTVDPDDE